MMHCIWNKIKNELLYNPSFWGIVFFALIPIFALIYISLPENWFYYSNGQNHLTNFVDALYFSTVTITTLGFGDITAISIVAKIIVIIVSLLGVLFIGLFLNAVSIAKSRLDALRDKEKEKENHISSETIKLSRQYVVMKPYLKKFIEYASIVSTPIIKRKDTPTYNPNFDFHDLYDLYQPTLRLTDDFKKSGISCFYSSLHGLETKIETMLRTIDFSLWPELDKKLLTVLDTFNKYDFESSILGLQNSFTGNKPATHVQSDLIRNWPDEVKFYPSNAINSAVALYYLIKISVPLLHDIETEILNVMHCN
jgi:hypothetical protein